MTDRIIGFRDAMPEQDYRKVAAIGSTDLSRLLDCPASFAYFRDNPEPGTEATAFGSLLHTRLLEPERFTDRYHITAPGFSRAAKVKDKENVDALLAAEAAGKRQAKQEDVDLADRIIEAVMACPDANAIITKADAKERSAFWTRDGVYCKARFDVDATTALGLIADVKVLADARPDAFARDRMMLGRAIQAAHYREGYSLAGGDALPDFAWIVVPSEPPFHRRVWVAVPSEAMMRHAQDKVSDALEVYKRCVASGDYPGYDEGEIRIIDAPAWWGAQEEVES